MEFGPILRAMRRNPFRFGLIVLEVAFTLAIVVNCVGMILDASKELGRPSGFDDHHLLVVDSLPFAKEFLDDNYLEQSIDQDLVLLRGLPGVRAATNTRLRPWQGGGSSGSLKPMGTDREMLRTQTYGADEGTLDTLGVAIVSGRNFTHEDVVRDPNASVYPILISKAYADLMFPGQEAVGKTLSAGLPDRSYPVVGVFDPFYNPYAWEIGTYATFFAATSGSAQGGVRFLVRTTPEGMTEVSKAIEERMLALNNGRNVTVQSIDEVKEGFQNGQSILVLSLNALIVLLVFVTALGIVGLTSFSVTERTRQIGTRRALGARRADILRYFLLENLMVTTMGVALGLLGAYGLNIALVSLMDGEPLSWWLPGVGMALLWVTGLAAALGPALRAMKVPPAIATRNV
ncbi:MAG: ABC transporter permease [Candidatus Polarisedimenticolia bacterium]